MIKSSQKLILEDVRGSYVYLTERRKNENGSDGKYGLQVLVKKDSPQHKKMKAAQEKVARAAFGEKVKLGTLKLPLRDGDEEREGEEYEGMMFFNANSDRKPGIVNRRGETADTDDLEEYCYSGAFYHVSMNLYSFNTDGNKGVAVGLSNVMLRKKGDRLDGSVAATSEFADFASADDEDEMDDFDDEL